MSLMTGSTVAGGSEPRRDQGFDRDRDQGLHPDRDQGLDRDGDQEFDQDRDGDRDRDRDREWDRDRAWERGRNSDPISDPSSDPRRGPSGDPRSGTSSGPRRDPSGDWSRDEGQGELLGPQQTPTDDVRRSARLAKFHVPEVVFGPGSLAELGHCALRLGGRRPFLVTDPGLIEAGWTDEAVGHLRRVGLRPVVWHELTPNPKDHEVEAGFRRYGASGCDVIVGVGGGSVIDAAKGVAILSSNGGRILDYEGVDRVGRPIPPTVMVPSTAGTGADVSQFAVITDTTEHIKISIVSRTLVPEISVIDPRLLTTMPGWLNAATGLDALTHAVEAFVSRAHNPLTDTHALHAVGLITRNLLRTQVQPRDFGARLAMAQASLEAGMAFTNAILGATHAMSHQVGGLLDAPHGVVNGVLLPHVIRFNAEAWPDRFVALGAAAGLRTEGVPPQEVAARLAELVRALADDVGVPKGLASLGVAESDVPVLARTTLKDACMATNPRDVGVRDIETLFREAL